MTNNNNHHFLQTVFPRQSDPAIEQLLPTSELGHADQRTNVFHPAGMPRISPLDVKDDISRALDRQPADQIGEWPHRPAHRDPRPATDLRTRPDSVPTHTRLSEPNGVGDTHHRQVVTLIQFDSHHKSESRPNIMRPGTGTSAHSPGEPQNRGVHHHPDSTQAMQEHAERPLRGVRQDKAHLESAPSASPQPSPVTKVTLSQFTNNDVVRSQNGNGAGQKSGRISFWADLGLRQRLESKALKEGLSISATCAAFLRKALQQDIDLEYSATLDPIIERSLAKHMRALSTRLAWLLVRVAFDSGQTRSIVTNILGRQSGMNQDLLKTILAESGKAAKANITRRTPQITELIEAVEKWIIEGDREHAAK
jgi:hypothetical protein